MSDEFREELKINENQLQKEVIEQSELFSKWALEHVAAKAEVDRTKNKLEIKKAELDKMIRSDPELEAKKIEYESQIETIAAEDGMRVEV